MTTHTPAVPLTIERLRIDIDTQHGVVEAVKNVTLDVREREILAIVGESGSGKTLTARAVLGFLPAHSRASGVIRLRGTDVLEASKEQLHTIRGDDAAMIFQEPSSALNPVFRIGWQMEEGLRAHGMRDAQERKRVAIDMLRAVGIPEPEKRFDYYPHQFSGGQKQRIVIAMALALRPSVIIADEPTTALDVTVQAEILELLRQCRDEFGASIVLITHNMGVVADLADRVAVMYQGDLVEQAPVDQLFAEPREEYTKQLLAAVPRLGSALTVVEAPEAAKGRPVTRAAEQQAIVSANGLNVVYSGGFRQPSFHAVHEVTFDIAPGEVLGLVGESGSGKSTIGKAISGLAPVDKRTLRVLGEDIASLRGKRRRTLLKQMGYVFQDPATSFNPFMTIEEAIEEPLVIHRAHPERVARKQRVFELLDAVQLPRAMATRRPYELSGGQRQRVGIARALALDPKLLIADEPTSALDVSVQAKVLEIFRELQNELQFACLFISHDLAVVEMLSDRIAVLKQGRLVELGQTAEIIHHATDPYTQALIGAVPVPDPVVQRQKRAAWKAAQGSAAR
ncbi:ABC transporter ATP-binding protein [Leucobacter sp. UCMA 4100]|uniref:dipeptide ABC transporter ATP-binding protein n=1 Tax=Leucobacter sp. UCMA 4100 TaxID=2810534 RepID=UPI0022EA59A8|nr:ABC transporter ATP-binding protein [Leucobacter sp. UCMA 4100]MDA3146997.1 ABC transporter ATP-binding protein [Leucobacter sp. UCMA 4100]